VHGEIHPDLMMRQMISGHGNGAPGRTEDRPRSDYPNERVMTDDVFSTRMIFMTHGQTTPSVGPHKDLVAVFPFLGMPQPE
jgi:hypothetical protein